MRDFKRECTRCHSHAVIRTTLLIRPSVRLDHICLVLLALHGLLMIFEEVRASAQIPNAEDCRWYWGGFAVEEMFATEEWHFGSGQIIEIALKHKEFQLTDRPLPLFRDIEQRFVPAPQKR